ncbi:GNAT family N-acetyltransferase, partial [Limosilactobacillus mucosae]|nr:GNAT family N-acetyltransferase [Limosilactobacillus mucosae]
LLIDTHEDNQPMQHLIEKYGFTRVGTLHGVYRPEETSYVYEMPIQEK